MVTEQEGSSFNLLTEPWVKVRSIDGDNEEVSLYHLLSHLDDYTDLGGESQTQNFSIFRLLQAIIIRSVRDADEIDDTFTLGERWAYMRLADLGSITRGYLEKHADRFDLFDRVAPFYQVFDLRSMKDEVKPASTLVPDVGPQLFSTSTQETSSELRPSLAARWLVRLHAYDTSGIKTGAVGDPRVKNGKGYGIGTGWLGAIGAVQIVGRNLRDTLVLNIPMTDLVVPQREQYTDLPPWERKPDTAAPRDLDAQFPNGLVDLLTWQQRRVRLVPNAEGTAVTHTVISNGDKIQVSNMFLDPSTGYRYSRAQSKNGLDVYFPRTHDAELTVWRGIQGIFEESVAEKEKGRKAPLLLRAEHDMSEELSRDFGSETIGLRLIGAQYGTQDAILTGEIFDEIPVSMSLLLRHGADMRRVAVRAVERVMSFRGSMKWFLKQLLMCGGASPEDEPTGPVQAWLNALEKEFMQWISGLSAEIDADEADKQWRAIMWRVSTAEIRSAVETAGPRAAVGRLEVTENGKNILHSSARYEAWIMRKLGKMTGAHPTASANSERDIQQNSNEEGATL